MNDKGHIVIFRPGALGDGLLAADALSALGEAFPGARVELVGHQGAGQVLQTLGLIHMVTSFDAQEVMPLFLDPPRVSPRWHDARLVVLWMRGAEPISAAFRRAGAGVVVTAPGEPDDGPVHVADYLTATLASAGVVASPSRGMTPPTLTLPRKGGGGWNPRTAIVHPGSGSARKNWPASGFAEICRRLARHRWSVQLLRGPADAEAVAAVKLSFRAQRGIRSHSGAPANGVTDSSSLRSFGMTFSEQAPAVVEPRDTLGLASVLDAAGCFVGNDSGVSHLAAGLGVPTVAVFGASDPRRWAPRGLRAHVVGDLGAWPSVEEVWSKLQALPTGPSGPERGFRPRGPRGRER